LAVDPEFVVVGHVSKPHGTKGELFVWPLTDRPESTFKPDMDLLVSDAGAQAPDPRFPPIRIAAVRPYRKGYLVFARGVEDRDGAEALRDRYLLRPFSETEPLENGEVFYHQLLGLRVVTVEGQEIGRIREVYELRPAELLEIEGADRDHLIPFTKQVVVRWDLDEGLLVIDPPEGLLEL
jgi:16S rRNA processing protein RimM